MNSSGVFSQNQDNSSIDRVTSVASIGNSYVANANMNDSGTFSAKNNNTISYNYNNAGIRKRG